MADVTYEDYQDLVRKLSLANERIRDLEKHVSGQDAFIAALEAKLAEARKALEAIYTQARSLPAHTSAVTQEHALTYKLAVIRDAAIRALTGGQEDG